MVNQFKNFFPIGVLLLPEEICEALVANIGESNF
jgi:hypothetical protein